MKDSPLYLLKKLLTKNKIRFSAEELSIQLQSHPSYPSLHSLTGVLDHFGIENLAAEVPVSRDCLSRLPNCFLAQIKDKDEDQLVLIEKRGNDYLLLSESNKKRKLNAIEFLKEFTGVILAVEADEKEITLKKSQTNFKQLWFILFMGILSLSFIFSGPDFISFWYFITSIAGLWISISILKQELGVNNFLGNALCTTSEEKSDCQSVLSSKGAKVFGNYKLSDLSLIYFLGFGLSVYLSSLQANSHNIHNAIVLSVIPISIYSIYYQLIVLKKWCFLCLGIVSVLWLQVGVQFFIEPHYTITLDGLLLSGLSFSFVLMGWFLLKPMILESLQGSQAKLELIRFKRNYTLFSSLLYQSPKVKVEIPKLSELIFGNKNAPLHLTIITNPFCGHCKPVHQQVKDILRLYGSNVKITIRFNVNVSNPDSNPVKVSSKILELYQKSESLSLQALHDIYEEGSSVDKWISKWGECQKKEASLQILIKEKEWCAGNAINFTPKILVNGHSYPEAYGREDLIYFIEDLYENEVPITESPSQIETVGLAS